MSDLYLMMGCPGSGKSTFIKNKIKNKDSKCAIISRDEIRFSITKPDEPYFAHENEVCAAMWEKINVELANGKNVFVDQTSLTVRSRKWLLQHVKVKYDHLNIIWVDASLETCLARNKARYGTMAFVPEESLIRMYKSIVPPLPVEGFYRIFKYNSETDELFYKGATIK